MSRTPLTLDAVLALSPDDASTKAARGLTSPNKWPTLGCSDTAVWGECQGSGSKPYQTQVDVSGAGPTFKCSCPSRKFPCKHGLALLLIQSQDAARFTSPEPAWVTEWLTSRKDRAEKKEIKAAAPPAPVDEQAVAKRENKRWQRIAAGSQELGLWLDDVTRKGLASLSSSDQSAASNMAARMVDAQAPGLGQRLTQAMQLVSQGQDWPARLLEQLGLLQLVIDAVAQHEQLPPALQADVRQALGWPIERDEVLANGQHVTDQWHVIAHALIEREAKLTERRVWLQGATSGQRALLIDFSYGGKPFEQGWLMNQHITATLAFYPSASPVRALLCSGAEAAANATGHSALTLPANAQAEWDALAQRIAANPLAQRWPLLLGPACIEHTLEGWALRTDETTLPLHLSDSQGWTLMAYGAGQPLSIFGEWDGTRFQPLSAWNAAATDTAPPWAISTITEAGV